MNRRNPRNHRNRRNPGNPRNPRNPRNHRKLLLIALLVIAVAMVALAPEAMAAAGGGSSGFGGGGGGEGGGGRGAGLYILIQVLVRIAVLGHGLGALVLVGLFVLYLIFTRFVPGARNFTGAQRSQGRSARRRVAERQRRVERAAAEAAEDDPAFAPDVVKPAAIRLFEDIQTAWDAGDRAAVNRLVSPRLAREWQRRLDDLDRRGWRNRVKLLGEPRVEYVGLTHGGPTQGDSVVVRIEAKMRDYVEDRSGNHIKRTGRLSETTHTREFWTLTKRHGDWVLASIEQGAEGEHALDSKLIPTPWSDDQALRDEALTEAAVQDAVPDGTNLAELADLDFDGDAHAAALDLSLADGRFAPDLLEIAARRAVQAWATAVDGDDGPLRRLASAGAVHELLHPGDPSGRTRLVVRGPEVKTIRIAGLDAAAQPPTMTIELGVTGRRYLQDRDTAAIIAGNESRPSRFTERWTLALDDDQAQPWRIVSVNAPVGLR
jgi:predicted lipid-binding transport protein (Tim44 family)